MRTGFSVCTKLFLAIVWRKKACNNVGNCKVTVEISECEVVRMKNKPFISKLFIALFCAVLLVSAAFLTFIYVKGDAEIVQKRSDGGFRQIKNATCEEFSRPGTPLGVVTEYRFRLSETFARDEHLAFYAVHQYAEVYIDEELVYSLKPSKNNPYVKTVGSNWIMIPLYYEDA